MKVLGPAVVVTMVMMVAAIPTVPVSSTLTRESGGKVPRDGAKALTKFLDAVALKATLGPREQVQMSKKKDLSKEKFEDSEARRIRKKALAGLPEGKRNELSKEMRAENKRVQIKAQEQTKALHKLAKKHESLSGGKKASKAKENTRRIKREAEMKEEKAAMKLKLAKLAEEKKFEKTRLLSDKHSKKEQQEKKKENKMSKELEHGKHLKKNSKNTNKKEKKGAQKSKSGSFLSKHLHDDHASALKSAQPYMKEGRTPEERRALKALRLRVKRDAKHLKAFAATQLKAPASDAAAGRRSKAGHHSVAGRRKDLKNLEDEVSGNELGDELEDEVSGNELGVSDTVMPDLGDEALGVPHTVDSPDVVEDDEEPPTVTTINNEMASDATAFPRKSPLEVNHVSAEPIAETRITYEEPSSSGNSLDVLDIVTLSSIDASAAPNGDIRESSPPSSGDLDLPEIPEIGDNSLIPNAGGNNAESEPDLDAVVTPTRVPAVTGTPSEAPARVTTEAPTNVRKGPWPWEVAEGEAEPCGRARFGPETRRSRGTTMLKILDGKEALPGAFPWQVAILDVDRDLRCGGTLIAPRWVMTAAHCVQKRMLVRLSEHHIRQKDGHEIEQKVRRVYVHPSYNGSTIDNDIALLRLPALPPFLNNNTGGVTRGITDRACLPQNGEHFPPVGTRCLVMGWGKASISGAMGTDVLMYTRLPIISRKACRRANRKNITENMFCAGHYKGGSDTCSGDSGGPLLCSTGGNEEVWTAFGVTSFGDGCGLAGKMGVYARVSNYLDWMAGIMRRYVL